MGMNYDDFIKRLREERTKNQLSYRGIGENIQMSYSYYFKGEAGLNRFSYFDLQNICQTKLNVFYVFTGKRSVYNCRYKDILSDANMNQIISCLLMINILAEQRMKQESEKEEWMQIYYDTRYLRYIYTDFEKVKNIFRLVREHFKVKQISMAAQLQMDVKTLRKLEKGKTLPDSEIIFNMYDKYGVSPSAFLQDEGCFREELIYLLNSQTEEVGETLLLIVNVVLTLVGG